MNSHVLTPDTQAILLLCGSLGASRAREAPLTQGEYNQVAQWLQREQLRPADLLEPAGIDRVQTAGATLPLGERVLGLVARGAALALAVEAWTNKGLWVVGRSDPDYPRKLRARLARQAPPILYSVGERRLLEHGGLAIVGSRDADEEGLAFARAVVQNCTTQEIAVISGGARGVDSAAMETAIEAEGVVIGVLADSLSRAAVARKYRAAIREGRLVLISPFDPDAGFNVGNAMNRNKAIYALSDMALVVSATLEKGGTWSGAVENLQRGWVPLFVRAEEPQLPGNRRLIELGGYSVDRTVLNRQIAIDDWLAGRQLASAVALPLQPAKPVSELEAPSLPAEQEAPSDFQPVEEQGSTLGDIAPALAETVSSSASNHATQEALVVAQDREQQHSGVNGAAHHDLFEIVWPHLQQALTAPRTDREMADLFQVELKQAQIWLRRAVEQGRLNKLQKPIRYVIVESSLQTLPLFNPNDSVL